MFAHIFSYRLRCLLRDKETIFWTLLFPLLLAVLFYMGLSNVNKGELFHPIDIAVVDDANYQSNYSFKRALEEVSQGDDRLFNLTTASRDRCDQLLNNNSIDGYILVENVENIYAEKPIKLVVKESGFNQNIIKSFIDSYLQTQSAVSSIMQINPTKQQELLNSLGERERYLIEVSASRAEPDNILNYFYTLIAMACFYGSFFGMREITDIQADISALAARVSTAPVHKLKALLSSMSASLLIHLTEMGLLLIFLRFVLQVDFGPRTGLVLLTTVIGSLTGVFFGAFISALVKKSEGVKIAVLVSVTLIGSFLAGMMYQNMKYIVAQKAPLLSYLNPVNLLTDAFYCLYYYDTFTRYALNMGILCIFIILFCVGTYSIIRRRQYASL
ncbi:MAG TPA: ABC transporter permease [Syntrophaceticus sp.]|nr:ABC transporter permease [Syntrophaceticus sp.]